MTVTMIGLIDNDDDYYSDTYCSASVEPRRTGLDATTSWLVLDGGETVQVGTVVDVLVCWTRLAHRWRAVVVRNCVVIVEPGAATRLSTAAISCESDPVVRDARFSTGRARPVTLMVDRPGLRDNRFDKKKLGFRFKKNFKKRQSQNFRFCIKVSIQFTW